MIDPYILPECGHTFCKSCVLKLKESGPKHCATCRQPISGNLQTNYTVKTLVAKVEAKCTRCERNGEILALLKHKCPEEEIKCSNDGCEEKIKRRKSDKHQEECLYKVMWCDRCFCKTTLANQEVHMEQLCREGKITCPLKCTRRIKRYE